MAMINCPECGQEISDKAKKCIHCGKVLVEEKVETKTCTECGKEVPLDATECPYCGCPIEENEQSKSPEVAVEVKKKNIKKIIIPIIAVIIVAVIGITIYSVKVIKPKNTYNEAVSMLENGKYDDANKLFDEIKDYKDVAEIQEQLKYESYSYSAINSLKQYLKNPDSYQPYEILFYSSMGSEESSTDSSATEADDAEEEKYPVCIMHYGAQNGFGGNTTGYALCTYDSDEGAYTVKGSCDSLDEDDYDSDDEDDVYDLLICKLVNAYRDGDDTIGSIDLNRLKTVLKNDAYSTIKIIK